MKQFVKIKAQNEPCKFGIVVNRCYDVYLIKVARADKKHGRILGNPHYRLYGEKLIEKI